MLRKSLYGLKQSPRQWYRKFDSFIIVQGFKRSAFDSCAYFKHMPNETSIYLLLYVDDMLISAIEIQNLKLRLRSMFEMKELGEARKILGIEISRDKQKRQLALSQKSSLDKIVEKFNMIDAKEVSVPFTQHFKISHEQSPNDELSMREMSRIPYSNAVGSLMYSIVCTRPDLAHAMNVSSKFMTNPGQAHWNAVKWIFRYVKGTLDMSLVYGGAKLEEES